MGIELSDFGLSFAKFTSPGNNLTGRDIYMTIATGTGYGAAGNVGINNTSPSYKLDIDGDINFTGTLRRNGDPVDTSTTGTSPWSTSGTMAYYLTGKVGIGTSSPDRQLDIETSNTSSDTWNASLVVGNTPVGMLVG